MNELRKNPVIALWILNEIRTQLFVRPYRRGLHGYRHNGEECRPWQVARSVAQCKSRRCDIKHFGYGGVAEAVGRTWLIPAFFRE